MLTSTVLGTTAYALRIRLEPNPTRTTVNASGINTTTGIGESSARVTCAMRNSGAPQKAREWTIYRESPVLGSASVVACDLALALSAMVGHVPRLDSAMVIGELGLDGTVRPLAGVTPMVELARRLGLDTVILPRDCYHEAQDVEGCPDLVPVGSLEEALAYARDGVVPEAPTEPVVPHRPVPTFEPVRIEAGVLSVVQEAIDSRRNLLLVGPPGAGKTLIARRVASIMPDLEGAERASVARIWSAAGLIGAGRHIGTRRPFRAPHHTLSTAAMIGGGARMHPGEISLANNGVLFLDNLPEFRRAVIDVARYAYLEEASIIMRSGITSRIDARPRMVIGAMNPCPCGWHGVDGSHWARECVCMADSIERYMARTSAFVATFDPVRIEVRPYEGEILLKRCAQIVRRHISWTDLETKLTHTKD